MGSRDKGNLLRFLFYNVLGWYIYLDFSLNFDVNLPEIGLKTNYQGEGETIWGCIVSVGVGKCFVSKQII